MSRLSDLADVLIGCRVITQERWDQAARVGRGELPRILAHLAADPPDWWDGSAPSPPGLTEYQRDAITARCASNEFVALRRDLALNRFLLLDQLGSGGQGAVFKGWQLNPARFVAIKTLIQDSENGRKRFEQEARAMMKIQHPAVAKFHLYERVRNAAGTPTAEYLIAMEFVDGLDLSNVVRQFGPVPWAFAARWAVSLLGGLMVIHQNGFIHRDVKPHNVMVTGSVPRPDVSPQDTNVKLLDFGAVKRAEDEQPSTGSSPKRVFIGTREYAPPEQWGKRVVPASDIYALGGTLFFSLTGRPPYERDRQDPLAFMRAHTKDPIPDLRDHNPAIPVELNRLIRRMLSKDHEDRGTAAELIEDFRDLIRRETGDDVTHQPPPAQPQARRNGTAIAVAPMPRPARLGMPEPRSPMYKALDPVLATLERIFIPGHLRPEEGQEPALKERLAALLRRPAVLATLASLFILFILLIVWVW
jgi:serine/threonine protein kinase